MLIAHTKEVRLFQEVTGVKKSLVQQIVGTVEEVYLVYIHNHTTKSINNTVVDELTCLQYSYIPLMPHKLLECKDIIKKMTYHPQDPIPTVLSTAKELIEFSDITRTSYTQLQAVKKLYAIIHMTGKFGLAICEWDYMTTFQKVWVGFKHFFGGASRTTRNIRSQYRRRWYAPRNHGA